MTDPLTEVVTLLQPTAQYFKAVSCAGRWRARRSQEGEPFYFTLLEGSTRLQVADQAPITLQADDFVLIPAAYDFTMTSLEPPTAEEADALPVQQADGSFRLGRQDGPADVRALVGHGLFSSPDAGLLVSLLPERILVRHEPRLTSLLQLVRDEFRGTRPARGVVLTRLLEIVFIEALRSSGTTATPGLVRGLADARLAEALRRMHERPQERWTVAQLASLCALSRSAFFERFTREVGIAPMEYLLAWRMALAKRFLREERTGIAAIAERVGYGSASAFSVAFTRHVGVPPTRYLEG